MFTLSLKELEESQQFMKDQLQSDPNNFGCSFFIELIEYLKTKTT